MEISSILYQPKRNIAYLHNPKVACSTIKNSLLFGEVENVHAQFLFPMYDNPYVPIFSVVRNPYRRAVSAYLDKIGPNKDHYVWNPFCAKYFLDKDKEITFIEFLTFLKNTEDKYSIDHHFRPQHLNLLSDYVVPEFIGYIEDMSSVEEYLKRYEVPLLMRNPHKTKSKQLASTLLTEEAVKLIQEVYEKDFRLYGYGENVDEEFNLKPIVREQKISDEVVFGHSRYDLTSSVELFRDSALLLEKHDLQKALDLMRIAASLRPEGPYIQEKIKEYEALVQEKSIN